MSVVEMSGKMVMMVKMSARLRMKLLLLPLTILFAERKFYDANLVLERIQNFLQNTVKLNLNLFLLIHHCLRMNANYTYS